MREARDENEPAIQDQPGLEGEAADVGVERVARSILARLEAEVGPAGIRNGLAPPTGVR